jgi:hypothetical protein
VFLKAQKNEPKNCPNVLSLSCFGWEKKDYAAQLVSLEGWFFQLVRESKSWGLLVNNLDRCCCCCNLSPFASPQDLYTDWGFGATRGISCNNNHLTIIFDSGNFVTYIIRKNMQLNMQLPCLFVCLFFLACFLSYITCLKWSSSGVAIVSR